MYFFQKKKIVSSFQKHSTVRSVLLAKRLKPALRRFLIVLVALPVLALEFLRPRLDIPPNESPKRL